MGAEIQENQNQLRLESGNNEQCFAAERDAAYGPNATSAQLDNCQAQTASGLPKLELWDPQGTPTPGGSDGKSQMVTGDGKPVDQSKDELKKPADVDHLAGKSQMVTGDGKPVAPNSGDTGRDGERKPAGSDGKTQQISGDGAQSQERSVQMPPMLQEKSPDRVPSERTGSHLSASTENSAVNKKELPPLP